MTTGKDDDKPGLDAETQAQLGKKLKEAYSDVINEPVPDRFKNLLDQLAASGTAGSNQQDEN
ncbi:MAG: NepR family anti-sigma factor [Pseudomonadota bacterium]